MSKTIKTVGVIGCGQMGSGIGIVSVLKANLPVIFLDSNASSLNRGQARVFEYFDRMVKKQKLTEARVKELLPMFSFVQNSQDLGKCDFIVEAINEDFDLKKKIINDVESSILSDSTIFASNTSSISITKLAACSKRPANFVGMHFFNPVPVMNLVEVISGLQTSEETMQRTLGLAQLMGKETVQAKDVPGFITNRVLMPWINEAIFALQEGIASIEDIDKAMKLGTNVPMGPLTLADFIGLDTCLAIMKVLYQELGNQKFAPCPLLCRYVDAGKLGRKTGNGFYKYDSK